jgi:uncharacterized protein YkwD
MPNLRVLRVLLAGGLAVAALFLIAPGTTRHSEAIANCSAVASTDSAEEAFLGVINNYRAANGLQPLTISANLNRAAEWMAQDLAKRPFLSHTDSLGRDPQQRMADCGGAPWFGENLAAGTRISTADMAFSLWKRSGGHNRNMLLADYKQIGIARYYAPSSRYTWYWVTTFSIQNDGTGPNTPDAPAAAVPTVSPAPGSTLTSSTATFSWSPNGADEYWLTVGTTPGGWDLYSSSLGAVPEATVTNLPMTGQTIYVRHWYRHRDTWSITDYTYVAGSYPVPN